jgi:hypothetical protein
MEDILASIRRILSEDETAVPPAGDPGIEEAPAPPQAAAPPEPPPVEDTTNDDVLVLDGSMLVPEADPHPDLDAMPQNQPEPEFQAEQAEFPPADFPGPAFPEPDFPGPAFPDPELPGRDGRGTELLGPEAAAAATSSVSHLMRTLYTDRSTQVYRGGPTIEDVVREEIRPLLKQWLDVNLPPLVERLVRIEIERVVGRAVP